MIGNENVGRGKLRGSIKISRIWIGLVKSNTTMKGQKLNRIEALRGTLTLFSMEKTKKKFIFKLIFGAITLIILMVISTM